MNWTKTPPTKEGSYWVVSPRHEAHIGMVFLPYVVQIVKIRDVLRVLEDINECPTTIIEFSKERNDENYWSDEPIAQPEWHKDFDKFETGN